MKQAAALLTPQFSYAAAPTWANATLKLENTSPLEGWTQWTNWTNRSDKPSAWAGKFPENALGADALAAGYQALLRSPAAPWH
jgi:hypothetical protein